MKRWFVPLALAALLLAFGAVAAGCGGGGEALTLEEFFQRVGELDDEQATREGEIEAQLGDLETLEESEALARIRDNYPQFVTLLEDFVDGLAALEPPEEAAELHEKAVSAGREVVRLFGDLVGEVENAESLEDFFFFFETEEINAASERSDVEAVRSLGVQFAEAQEELYRLLERWTR